MFKPTFWKQLCWWILFISAPMTALKANPAALQQAQAAFEAHQNGQYSKAIQGYEQVLETGYSSPQLYNNLGLAYAKQGQLGKAIVQWERALKRHAQNQEAQHNLQAAKQHIQYPIEPTATIALVKWWQYCYQIFSAKNWGIFFLLLWSIAFVLGGYTWAMNKGNWSKQPLFKIALGLLAISVLVIPLGLTQQSQEQADNIAIVIAQEAGLRPSPELSSKEIEILSEGIRLQLLEEQGEWVKVELPNYLVGWIPKSLLEKV